MDPNYPEEKVPVYQPINQPLIAYSDQIPQEIVILPSNSNPAILQRRSRKSRVARAVLTTITLWVAYIIFFNAIKRRGPGASCDSPESFERPIASAVEWPIPPDVNIDDCANLTQDPATAANLLRGRLSSSAMFELPLSSEKLFLLARGASAGTVNIIQSDEAGENIKVRATATYRHESALSQIRLCVISRHGGQRGIGIFSPQSGWRVGIHYDITVYLPSAPRDSPLQIKNFETDLPLFVHDVGRLADTVHFDTLSLKSSKMQIRVESLSATIARIETMNAKIEGTFYTSSLLELATYNAPIKVNVGLTNGRNSPATRLTMSTTNAALTARMSLISGVKMGGQFKVSGYNSMGPVDLAFAEAPIGSSLMLNAQTTHAPATIKLHSTYEGEFKLATSVRRAELSVDKGIEDPAGRGRRRAVEIRQAGSSHVSGSVSWSPEGRRMGTVNVETSVAPVVLRL